MLQFPDPFAYLSVAALFGIAAQFQAMDGYFLLHRIISIFERRIGIVYAVAAVATLFSPFIMNDVVILVLTPVLIKHAKQYRVDIAPLIVSEVTFTNIAGSLTPIGNPQNILLWISSGISYTDFVLGTWLPLAFSGIIALVSLAIFRLRPTADLQTEAATVRSLHPAIYLAIVTLMLILSELASVPSYLALAAGFMFGFAFTVRFLRLVRKMFDFKGLLILYFFIGSVTLFSGFLKPLLGQYAGSAASGAQPYSAMFMALSSNLISNVPATQLLLSVASIPPVIAPRIAVEAGLAGNLDPISSFALLLALLMVRRAGLPVRRAIGLQLIIGIISFLPAAL